MRFDNANPKNSSRLQASPEEDRQIPRPDLARHQGNVLRLSLRFMVHMSAKTFGQRADNYANNANDQPWFEAREAHLSELLNAFWLGEFEDESSGDTRLSIEITSNPRDAPSPATRKWVFQVLPTGAPWMPEEVRRCNPKSPPYHVLARMRARQYEPGCLLNLLERISIADDTYHPWLRSRQITPQAQDQPGQPGEQKTKHRATHKHDVEADAKLRLRIENVRAIALRTWPNPQKRPPDKTMARDLTDKHGKKLGYKFSTIHQILIGTYPASKRLGIGRF